MKTWEPGKVSADILGTVRITVEELMDVLKCIKVDKSPGPDQVYPRTLREAGEDCGSPG